MTRTLANLCFVALGLALLLGGLWAITRGEAAAGETDGLVRGEESVPVAAGAADLVGVQDPAAVLQQPTDSTEVGARVAVESGEAVEFASVSGALHLPPAFDPTEPTEVFAWPIEGGDLAPVRMEVPADARTWRFSELPLGEWVFSARAVAGDHCAWGKSRAFPVGQTKSYDGVEIGLIEYGVGGVVADVNGVAVPGIDVNYNLEHSDPTAKSIAEWNNQGQRIFHSAGDVTFTVNLGGENLAFEDGFLRADVPGDIKITTLAEMPRPSLDASEAILNIPTLDLGGAVTNVGEMDVDATVALLEAMTKQIEQELPTSPIGSPNLNDPRFGAVGSLGALRGWNFAAPGEGIEEGPSIPSAGSVTTDSAGRFWIALPGPGTVNLHVAATRIQPGDTDPGYLAGTTSAELTHEAPIGDSSLALDRAAALSGRIVRGDGVLNGINVFLKPINGGNTSTSTTDGEGHFQFSARKPGQYVFYARSGGDSGQDYCTSAIIDLRAGAVYSLDDVLTRSSSLTGILIDGGGEPVVGATVTAFGANNRSLKRTGKTDQWGVFTIVGMYPVEYTLEASGSKLSEGTVYRVPPGGGMADAGTQTVGPVPKQRW